MRLPWINRKYLTKRASKVTEADVKKAVDESDSIRTKFEHAGPLGRYINDVKLLISLVKDYRSGEYRAIPWWAVSAIVFTLLYVVSPVDLIPDFIPVIGYLDDAAVVSVCLLLVEQELQTYKKWKLERAVTT
jgi:uncharacterized membrane protein YkvA (DUF1232 family)